MSSQPTDPADVDQIFETYKETKDKTPQIDVIIEHYLSLVSQLKKDLKNLKDDFVHHRQDQGQFADKLEDYINVQKMSATIFQNLLPSEIFKKLNETTGHLIPILKSEIFLWHIDHFEAVSRKPSADLQLIVKCAYDEGIINWLWEQRHPVVVPLSDFMVYDQLKKKKGNVIIVPMMDHLSGIGIYVLLVEKDKSFFTLRDLELLNIFAQQATLAIKFEELKKNLGHKQKLIDDIQDRTKALIRKATVGEIAAGIAHEINNPLQIIMGNIQMARMGHKLEVSLEIIEKQSFRIANIVRGLLNMSRQNNESSSEILEVNPLILNTLKLIRGQIEKRNIEINLNLDENLPVIQCGSIYFQQILLNFILHAKMQIGQNGNLEINTIKENGDWIVLEFCDSGVSMPDEYINKALDPFSDLENGSEINLGLTVSVQMVNDLGGEVVFDNQSTKGNKIQVKLPTMKYLKKTMKENEVATG
jgi:signal transduction histidine kinase